MEQTFAALTGAEHYVDMLDGYDGLVDCVESQSELTPEATYTHSVLQLDSEVVNDGMEGFLDSVKRGAIKVYEWIKSIIRAIRDWFKGPSKQKYDEAKKDLKDGVDIDKKLDELGSDLKSKGLAAVDKDVAAKVSRLPSTIKNEVSNEIKETSEDVLARIKSKQVISEITTGIATKVLSRIKVIQSKSEEIIKLDPTEETLKKLGVDHDFHYIFNKEKRDSHWSAEDQQAIKTRTFSFVSTSEQAQEIIAKATLNLDKMNEAAKGNEAEQGRGLSRAVAVVKLLTEIAEIYRDAVITINSQAQIGIKKAESEVVKAALKAVIENSEEATNTYLQQAADSL